MPLAATRVIRALVLESALGVTAAVAQEVLRIDLATARLMFVEAADREHAIKFRSISQDGRTLAAALVNRPPTKAEDRAGAPSAGLVGVTLDGDVEKALVERFAVVGYPAMVDLDAAGKELRRAVGYQWSNHVMSLVR